MVKANFDYAILKSQDSNQFYVTVRGTQLKLSQDTLIRDLINDGMITVGIIPHRTKNVLVDIEKLKHDNPGANITVVGHSLGGTISEYIGKLDKTIKVVSFNPGESIFTHLPYSKTLSNLLGDFIHVNSNIHSFNINGFRQ